MEKCRICLSSKRNLRSIFESTADGNSFVVMMESLANVKIVKDDGTHENICQTCCNKLVAACSFKVQLERSEEVLQNSASKKKFCFSNLQDIKTEIFDSEMIIPKCENKIDDYFKDGESSMFYSNTIIKKIETVEVNKKEPSSVIEYLNNFTVGSDHDYDDDIDYDNLYVPQSDNESPEFELPLSERKQKPLRKKLRNCVSTNINDDYMLLSDKEDEEYFPQSIKKSRRIKDENISLETIKKRKPPRKRGELRKVLIKPVILSDIQVLRAKELNKNTPKVKKKYPYRGGKVAMCNYCGKMTKSIKSHLLTHTGNKPFKCDLCDKAFYSESGLTIHKRKHQGKIFKCDLCVASFNSKVSLKSHAISHSDETRYKCDFCNKSFKRRGTRNRHKLMHNVTNKCIKCDLCNMSFFTNDGLKHHMRVHTGERPYKCEICSQPYSYKHDFNRHCFKKHGIFLKRRSVYVMNGEVMARERALMQELMLKLRDAGGELRNPFEGPQAAMAFEQAIKALQAKKNPID